MRSSAHRWTLAAGGLAVVALLLFTVQRLHLFDKGKSTPIAIEEIRDRFRETAGSTTTVAAVADTTTAPTLEPTVTLAAPGVYLYATTGSDSIDALTGDHHTYPPTTTITITPAGCGVSQRWDVLQERWQQWQDCVVDAGQLGVGMIQTERTNFDQFFGQSQTDTYLCDGDPRPVAAAAGTTWVATCASGGNVDRREGSVIGTERLTVGAASVVTEHVRVEVISAVATDKEVVDTWYLQRSNLIVKQQGLAATSNATQIGTVHYAEAYTIQLTTLEPIA